MKQNENGIFISQKKYANDILKRFNMLKCKSTPTPIAMGMKLNQDDKGSNVNPPLYKKLFGNQI